MNKARRKQLEKVISTLQDMRDEIDSLSCEEMNCYEALPEGLQYSEKGENMEACADELNDANDELEDVISSLQEIFETY